MSESLQGVRVVAMSNRQRHNVLNHRNVVGEYRDRNDETARVVATYGASTEFVGIIGQAMLLLVGGLMVQSGQLTIGQLTAFILYLNAFFQPIQQLVQQYNLFQQGQAAIVKLDELLGDPPDRSRRRQTPGRCHRSRARSTSSTCRSGTTRRSRF